jgi:hypothetical protein
MTRVIEVAIPAASRIHGALKQVHFSDAYEAVMSRPSIDAQGAYAAVFGHRPSWIMALLQVRGLFAKITDLKHPPITDVGPIEPGPERRPYAVGERVGLFTVQGITAKELILGLDDKHLNFRVSVLRSKQNGVDKVTVSTVVELHNSLGRAYLFVVKPFHKLIVRSILDKALITRRL